MNADANVFFALWLQKPLRIAAATPSGARLADAVARCIDLKRPGPVLELGAGTGSLTQGLVRAGCEFLVRKTAMPGKPPRPFSSRPVACSQSVATAPRKGKP